MSDSNPPETEADFSQQGLIDRHPKLGIYLIAGIFYLILFGMCAFVAVLIWV